MIAALSLQIPSVGGFVFQGQVKLFLLIGVLFSLASYPEASEQKHGAALAQPTQHSSERAAASDDGLSPEQADRKKLLNEVADSDRDLKDGREKLQSAVNSVWGSLAAEEKSALEAELQSGSTEKLSALLNEKGLVLSSKDKREKFLGEFQTQLKANLKRSSSEGISELIKTSNQENKGDPQKRQEQLAAKEALRVELEKNKSTVDYLKKNMGWTAEDSLLTVKRVGEQSKLLASGTQKEKAGAQDYLSRVFGQVYVAGVNSADKPSNAITDFFGSADVRESEFGKVARPFITAGMGKNFVSKENPYGACAGIECARDFIEEALTKSSMKANSASAQGAVEQYEKQQTLPSAIKTENGKNVPTISDEGIENLANKYAVMENNWLGYEKEQRQKANGLPDGYSVDQSVSLETQKNFDALFDRPEVKNGQATIWLSKKENISQPDGTKKESINGHVVTVTRLGTGADRYYLVRDPNIKGLSFDSSIRDGKFNYSYSFPDGQKASFEWDNFFPSPSLWNSEQTVSTK